ncbi:MAG: LysM peptidoglycan-binding domain-containing protein, partial [Actinobacteria bacterium]|nr:LysM peptidoglycan-binding domain-containing protein [Actinomycetota bacterium]
MKARILVLRVTAALAFVVALAAAAGGSPAHADSIKYTVKPGDTLSAIADSFDVIESAIQEANSLSDPNAIRAGMVLTIPGASPPPTPTPASTQYTVKQGDSLGKIAESTGVSVQAIQDANGLKDPNAIKVGQVLTIPASSQPAPAATPQPSPTPAPTPVSTQYTVKAGDSLGKIAESTGA